jgi:hypothetical protein
MADYAHPHYTVRHASPAGSDDYVVCTNAGFTPPANWWEYNGKCRGVDLEAVVNAVKAHEYGHFAANRLIGTTGAANLPAMVEGVVGLSEAQVVSEAEQLLDSASFALGGTDEPPPT